MNIVNKFSTIVNLLMIYEAVATTEDNGTGKANLLSIIFGSAFSRRCNCNCGVPNRDSSRILGGSILDPHEFPWLTILYIKSTIPVTGTLLNDRYIISAATPFIGLTPYDIKVTVGSHFTCFPDVTSTNYSVSEIFIHPEYGAAYRRNDLALLKLNTVVPYDQQRVLPVCLPTPGSLYTGQVSTVASYINSLKPDTKLCEPKKVGLPVLENRYCPGRVFASTGCIGVIGTQNVLCQADVGSGIYYRTYLGYYELAGILSDQQDCTVTGNLGVSQFTRVGVASNLNWILKLTSGGCFCNKP